MLCRRNHINMTKRIMNYTTIKKTKEKLFRRMRYQWVNGLRHTAIYKYCYSSYYHYLFFNRTENDMETLYLSAKPNPGAGIGHQLANWNAGYWFAKQFGIKFAHIPFSSDEWERFLGFYQGEKKVSTLLKEGYKIVRLQEFDENNEEEIERIKKIIKSYAGTKTVFLLEQDQVYAEQFGVREEIQSKFYSCPYRKKDKLIFDSHHYNVAVHVRRGDILNQSLTTDDNLTMRYQNNDYFVNALRTALNDIKDEREVHIYLFSQGKKEDFFDFLGFSNLHYCLDMDPILSLRIWFLRMC